MLIWDNFFFSIVNNEREEIIFDVSYSSDSFIKNNENNYNKIYYQHIEQLCYKPTGALVRNLAGSSFNKSMYACQI